MEKLLHFGTGAHRIFGPIVVTPLLEFCGSPPSKTEKGEDDASEFNTERYLTSTPALNLLLTPYNEVMKVVKKVDRSVCVSPFPVNGV